jgi:hypothetical protein
MRRLVIAALSAAAVAPIVAAVVAPPAVNTACADGETGVTNGCAPFCLPGRYFDYEHTGLCLPVPPPPLPANGVVPQSFST